ncbi:hypothetical protein FQN57_003165 [Myotisia sp. PD_48]|nr:hypothetical protein FQN57_003165 [Myotisia sp. PD_48]
MSLLTIASLPRITRDELADLIQNPVADHQLAIIDVRDSDHVGGHIISSRWISSSSLELHLPELLRTLKDVPQVVFYCALSQQRGPTSALKYARMRLATNGIDGEATVNQKICVLEGGFVNWQEKFGKNPELTEAYVEDIWQEY